MVRFRHHYFLGILRYIIIPGKCLLICKPLDVFVYKLDVAFRTLDLVPDLAVQIVFDAFLKATAAYRWGVKTSQRDPGWWPDPSSEVFSEYDAASWRKSRDVGSFRGGGRPRSVGRLGSPFVIHPMVVNHLL